eukprot:8335505-Alexandrium_andersonii.AAC.1
MIPPLCKTTAGNASVARHGLEARMHAFELLLSSALCRGVVKRQPLGTQTTVHHGPTPARHNCLLCFDDRDDLPDRAALPRP